MCPPTYSAHTYRVHMHHSISIHLLPSPSSPDTGKTLISPPLDAERAGRFGGNGRNALNGLDGVRGRSTYTAVVIFYEVCAPACDDRRRPQHESVPSPLPFAPWPGPGPLQTRYRQRGLRGTPWPDCAVPVGKTGSFEDFAGSTRCIAGRVWRGDQADPTIIVELLKSIITSHPPLLCSGFRIE